MSFVGIPQACEAIAIDLEVLSGKLRMHAQAIRRADAVMVETEKQSRALSRKAVASLTEFLSMLPAVTEEPKKKVRKTK